MKSILPQNYRGIPATLHKHASSHKKLYMIIIISLEGVFFLSFLVTSLFLLTKYLDLQKQRKSALLSMNMWEKEITRHPNYPEVYYNAALFAERAGDRQKALEYTNESLMLNPTFEASKKLQEELMR